MSNPSGIPARIEGFFVLPVSLPVLPSFPHPSFHYFYASTHDPKHADETTPQSLFLANIPIDANDILIKHLLGEQLDLPAGRIQDVQFRDARGRPEAGQSANDTRGEGSRALIGIDPEQRDGSVGRKRKRDLDLQEQADGPIHIDLPPIWDRTVHAAGTNAIVIFVDRASRDAALKAIKSVVPGGKKITWGEGLRKEMPPLGLQREFCRKVIYT
jgi:Rrp7 RRM-like N-terminal domain